MKNSYENNKLIISCSFFFFIIVIFLCIYSIKKDYKTYHILNSVVSYENTVELMVSDKEYKQLRRIKFVYIENKKKTFQIKSVIRNVLKREKEFNHHIVLELEIDKEKKAKDSISIVIYDDKKSLFSLLINSFKEEK